MNFLEKITGSDMTMEFRNFESRIKMLPVAYQETWRKVQDNLWSHANFSGRNLIPILEGILGMFEESAAKGLSIEEVLGEDIHSFCSELAKEEGAKSLRDKWRMQLNKNVARKLGK